jgi:cell division protein WhiA
VSFSEGARAELAAIDPRRPCCRLAELSALARTAGTLHLRGGGSIALHMDVGSPAVARRAFSLLRGFGAVAEIRAYRRHAFGRETRFELHLEEDPRVVQVLNEAGVVDARLAPLDEIPRRVVARSCCRAAYLRGALLAAGSVSGPRAPQLELRTATREAAELLAGLAQEEGMRLGVVERDRHCAAYARGRESVAELLGFVGAHGAALALQEGAVLGATRSAANRLANADHANLVRASRSAQRELRAIRRLAAAGGLDRLPPELREIAELRLRHPTLALRELASRCSPPVTKAAAHRRLKRLERLGGVSAAARSTPHGHVSSGRTGRGSEGAPG